MNLSKSNGIQINTNIKKIDDYFQQIFIDKNWQKTDDIEQIQYDM